MNEFDALLEQTTDTPPCGPNLEYDQSYLELERAVQVKPEQVLGDHIIPATTPDWLDIKKRAIELLGRSKDIRIAVWLTRALVSLENLPGLVKGLSLIEGLLKQYWQEVHPQPDPDDGDITIRVNTLAALVDSEALLGDLRAAIFVQSSKHARLTVRDVEIASGHLPAQAGSKPISLVEIESAANNASENGRTINLEIQSALQSLKAINQHILEHAGPERLIDFKPLANTLTRLLSVFKPTVNSSDPANQADEFSAVVDTTPGPSVPAGIRNRDDVNRYLDDVCEYLSKHEPSNPAPLLIRRAQKMLTMDFVEIIKELAPDGLNQVKTIAGIPK